MDSSLPYLAVASTLLVGAFAGVLFAAFLAISPSLALLDGPAYTKVKQCQIRILQVAMSSISIGYLVLGGVLAYYAPADVSRYTLISLGLVVLALIYSAFTDIPYNGQILKWDAANPPAGWEVTRRKWDTANAVRMVPTLAAFIIQAYAITLLK